MVRLSGLTYPLTVLLPYHPTSKPEQSGGPPVKFESHNRSVTILDLVMPLFALLFRNVAEFSGSWGLV